MVHPNIDERRQHVETLLAQGLEIKGEIRRELTEKYCCSIGAIIADVISFTRPKTKESAFPSLRIKAEVRLRDGNVCQYCGDVDLWNPILEHVIPGRFGGVAKAHNLVIACQSCNVKKRSETWIPNNLELITEGFPEWRQKIIGMAKA